jgi:hypothetical protein
MGYTYSIWMSNEALARRVMWRPKCFWVVRGLMAGFLCGVSAALGSHTRELGERGVPT